VASGQDLDFTRLNRSQLTTLARASLHEFDTWAAIGIPGAKVPQGRGKDWEIDLSALIKGLFQRVKDAAAESDQRPAARKRQQAMDLDAERAELTRLQAEAQRIKNQALKGSLIPAAEVELGWQQAIGRARSLLLGIPIAQSRTIVMLAKAREAPDAERAVRSTLVSAIDAALAELANTRLEEDEAGESGSGAGAGAS
jgi:phage terminase Nu1 subunit (DNA packaging protein)